MESKPRRSLPGGFASRAKKAYKTMTSDELKEAIKQNEALLKNRAFLDRLPDKGKKLHDTKVTAKTELELRLKEEANAKFLESSNLVHEFEWKLSIDTANILNTKEAGTKALDPPKGTPDLSVPEEFGLPRSSPAHSAPEALGTPQSTPNLSLSAPEAFGPPKSTPGEREGVSSIGSLSTYNPAGTSKLFLDKRHASAKFVIADAVKPCHTVPMLKQIQQNLGQPRPGSVKKLTLEESVAASTKPER